MGDAICRADERRLRINPRSIALFTEQLATAQAELTAAEDALTEFAAQNDRALHQNELDALLQEQDNYLTAKSQIQQLLRDIESYQTQLDAANVSLTNGELTPLLLELRAFNAASRASFKFSWLMWMRRRRFLLLNNRLSCRLWQLR